MNRRQFTLGLPASLAAAKIRGWTAPPKAAAHKLYIAFSAGSNDFCLSNPYQISLRETVAALMAHGYPVHAYDWGSDYEPIKHKLTGICRLADGYFAPPFAAVIEGWLRSGPERTACVALGDFYTVIETPAGAQRIARAIRDFSI